MISFNLPRTLRDEEEGIDTPFVRQGPELVHWPSFQPGIVADFARFVRRLSPRPYHCVPPHPAPLRTIGPLRWPLCRNASGGLRSWSSGNGSGPTRPRRGLRWWFVRCPAQRSRAGRSGGSGLGEGAYATGSPATTP